MKSSLRFLAPALCLFAAAAALAQTRPAPRELDRVVAVVNADVITANELKVRLRSVERQLQRQRIEAPPADVLEKQILERLILDRALVQSARDQGIRVDDAQVDRAIARIAEDSKITPAQLRRQIETDGIPFQKFREDIREEILSARLREREVDARIQISEADVDAFLEEQRGAPAAPPVFDLSQILLRVPEGASAEQIERQRQRGEDIIRQLRGGADFAKLAASFSDAPDALSGGAIGPRPADRLPQLFVDAVAGLKPGEIAALTRSPNGFHVLKLVDRREGGNAQFAGAPVAQTRARHILIRPSELVSETEAVRRLQQIRQRVSSGRDDFADMARQYSSDGSAARGGDLGWLYPGDTVPEFERAMDGLQPGQISEPVRSSFGIHLIQVVERRTDAASPDRIRALARQALRERRIEETVQDWLRQVRDRTYVEYRDR